MLHLAAVLTTLATYAEDRVSGRTRRPRAVSMLEYVLIAAVILVVVAVFSKGFRGAVDTLVERIVNAINTGS